MAETFATADDIATVDPGKRYNNGTWSKGLGIEHWKYPETVGRDTNMDNINFNSHSTSEYATQRMDAISSTTSEPFIMFEFMKVEAELQKSNSIYKTLRSVAVDAIDNRDAHLATIGKKVGDLVSASPHNDVKGDAMKFGREVTKTSADFIKALTTAAAREYVGSICLYMPTDIVIGDTMVYNEDTRQFAAGVNELLTSGPDSNAFDNKAVNASKQAITAGAFAAGKFAGKGVLSALAGYGLGDIVSAEMQRSTGSLLNPNEFIAYSATGLRSFTFNWVILPDSEDESIHAAGLIKFFRKSAHAKRNDQITITVPDHVVTSFHGAKDMIQLPPCVIESVSVTYNPNVSSFFKQNNSPVEIGLSVTLKEMVPLYSDDVKAGY